MERTSEDKSVKHRKHINVGLLAHVDAGKTTLSEGLLYLSGSIRRLGRVDNRDAFLDTFELERERGITIFSKQAVLSFEDTEVMLLDTPGHVDFSAEMERTLQVLDAAVLVVSGADGVQGHTETLWKLLARYQVPVFLFVNKMDQDGTDAEALLQELKQRLDENCVDFRDSPDGSAFLENVAVCGDRALEHYLETGTVEAEEIRSLILQRKLFPCFFGSALKLTGVEALLRGLAEYTVCPVYPEAFGAKVYKIARDGQGNRLTYLKVTGGTLRVKDVLSNRKEKADTSEEIREYWEEKVNQIRIYSGAKYETAEEVSAGRVCAVTGLSSTFPGEGLGAEPESELPVLEPVLTYQIQLPAECDVHGMLKNLRLLEEEEPLLHIVWNERLGEIHAQLMGEVQIEVLKRLIWDRFRVRAEFGRGNIVYKETIKAPVVGVGHFEPLRHYAEVHILLEPGEPGSGLQFASACSTDVLDLNWQRLILTHLEEKVHPGVLAGAPVTDIRMTLLQGRAHLKHTEGGDFRQATYRAVRQGLKKAESILLEPYYDYRLEVPADVVGRAMSDLQRMQGSFGTPDRQGEISVLEGCAPVVCLRDYQKEVAAYSRGRGRLSCTLKGYRPCHNTEEVLEKTGYDSEQDPENPTGSVFCAHGAGFVVKWDQVEEYMHLESGLKEKSTADGNPAEGGAAESKAFRQTSGALTLSPEEEKELDRMAEAVRKKREQAQAQSRKKYTYTKTQKAETAGMSDLSVRKEKKPESQKEYLLVDGYNIIFAWEELKALAEENMDGARGRLMDILSNYQGMRKCTVILVFDAYRVEGFPGEVQKYHNIYVVYTKEAETADQYIEKTAHEIGRKYHVTVATSDGTEQVIIHGQGCHLLSAKELHTEIRLSEKMLREEYLNRPDKERNYLFHYLDEETAGEMEAVRLGKNKKDKKNKKRTGEAGRT